MCSVHKQMRFKMFFCYLCQMEVFGTQAKGVIKFLTVVLFYIFFFYVAVHFERGWMMERRRKVSISANEGRLPGRHSVAWTFSKRRV